MFTLFITILPAQESLMEYRL